MLKALSTSIFLVIINVISFTQDSKLSNDKHFSFKLGVYNGFAHVKIDPISSGRGLGCSLSDILNPGALWFGGKVGFDYRLKINQKFSCSLGADLFFTFINDVELTKVFYCAGATQSETKGKISQSRPSISFPLLVRYKFPSKNVFIEFGGFHDLGLSSDMKYAYEGITYRNYMNVPYPEPKIKNDVTFFKSSNFGFILGLGLSQLFSSENFELKLQYYYGVSKYVATQEYSNLRQHGIDLSLFTKW